MMSLVKPGRGALERAESPDAVGASNPPPNSSASSSDPSLKAQTEAAKSIWRDVYHTGLGSAEIVAGALVAETGVGIGLMLKGAKDVEQGLVGLLCDALSKTSTDNVRCHEAADYLDVNKLAGELAGALAGGSHETGEALGDLLGLVGDLSDAAEHALSGDVLGTVEKIESLREHAKGFIDNMKKAYNEKAQGASDGNGGAGDVPGKPGRGESGGWERVGGGPGDAGGIDKGSAVA